MSLMLLAVRLVFSIQAANKTGVERQLSLFVFRLLARGCQSRSCSISHLESINTLGIDALNYTYNLKIRIARNI